VVRKYFVTPARWLVAEGRMGDGTRVEASPKREKASSRLKCPALHQSLSEQNVALEQGSNYLISLMAHRRYRT
jgi:hypothetical protein